MPNCDFYATPEDHEGLLTWLFAQQTCHVYELASRVEQPLRRFCSAQETLALFEALGRPMQVVLGNNESHNLWPFDLSLERAGHRFFLTHIPPSRAPVSAKFVLHGHTHVPRDETDAGGVRWLNPGCITRPNRGASPSFAWLTLKKGAAPDWQLVRL